MGIMGAEPRPEDGQNTKTTPPTGGGANHYLRLPRPPIPDNNNVSGQPHGIAPTLNNTSEQFHNKSGQPRGVAPTDCIP
ncbi:hypothetical protein ES703_105017 [subsurface metagenome]